MKIRSVFGTDMDKGMMAMFLTRNVYMLYRHWFEVYILKIDLYIMQSTDVIDL